MTAYANDPRVTPAGGHSFKVDLSELGYEGSAVVWVRGDGTWVASRGHGSYPEFPTADDAIHCLIGEPRPC